MSVPAAPVAVDEEGIPDFQLTRPAEHRLVEVGEDALAGHSRGGDPQGERLLASAGTGREGGKEPAGLVRVQLVDDVGRGVETVLQRRVGGQVTA